MRNIKTVSAAMAMMLVLFGGARAQSKKASLPIPPPVPAKPSPKWAKLKGGTVLSVNAVAGTINIQAKDGTEASYGVTKNTRLHRNRKAAKLSDVMTGDHVMLARFNSATKEAVQLELFLSSGNRTSPPHVNAAGK